MESLFVSGQRSRLAGAPVSFVPCFALSFSNALLYRHRRAWCPSVLGRAKLLPGPNRNHFRIVTATSTLASLKQAAITNSLRSCRLFMGLAAPDLDQIAAVTVVKTLGRGDYLFRERESSSGFFIVQQGAINVHRVNAAGKEQIIHVFRAGDSFAEATLATDAGYPADARALESSQVLLVQKSGFVALLRRQPELVLRMLGSMSQHLRALVSQLEDLTLKDVETRLANWLVKRCPDPQSNRPCQIELGVTKRLLAAELGTVGETFSRTLAKFRQQKLILVKGRTLTVLSPSRLGALLRHNLGE
jgi:CRP/FNR family transcriptional regulator, dissimilatory nitrate respiration regulator